MCLQTVAVGWHPFMMDDQGRSWGGGEVHTYSTSTHAHTGAHTCTHPDSYTVQHFTITDSEH